MAIAIEIDGYPEGTTFSVRCESDGKFRGGTFDTYKAACDFADYGHFCTVFHTVVVHWPGTVGFGMLSPVFDVIGRMFMLMAAEALESAAASLDEC